jgi:hypothetical protein
MLKNIHKSAMIGLGVNCLAMIFLIHVISGLSASIHINILVIAGFITSFVLAVAGVYMLALNQHSGLYLAVAGSALFIPLGFVCMYGAWLARERILFEDYKIKREKHGPSAGPREKFPANSHHAFFMVMSIISFTAGCIFLSLFYGGPIPLSAFALIGMGIFLFACGVMGGKEGPPALIIHEDRFEFLTGRPYGGRAGIYYSNIIDAKIATNLVTMKVRGQPGNKEEVRMHLGMVTWSLRVEAYAAIEDTMNKFGIPVSVFGVLRPVANNNGDN